MNLSNLKGYAPQARRDFIQATRDRAAFYGLTVAKTEPVVRGEVAVIGGRDHPRSVAEKRRPWNSASAAKGSSRRRRRSPTRRSTASSPSASWSFTDTWITAFASSAIRRQGDAGNPRKGAVRRPVRPQEGRRPRPLARRRQGAGALSAASRRPVQRSSRGYALPVRKDRRRDRATPPGQPPAHGFPRSQARRRH